MGDSRTLARERGDQSENMERKGCKILLKLMDLTVGYCNRIIDFYLFCGNGRLRTRPIKLKLIANNKITT